MSLRPYQTDLLTKSLARFKAGVNKQLLTLPTGMGKTVCLANLSSHHGFTGKTLVVVHREELADQTAEKMLHWNPGMAVGIEMGDRHSSQDDQTVVASVQTLSVSERRLAKIDPEEYSLLIIDECFVGSTLVDGRPISSISVGDTVTSFDEKTGSFQPRTVTHVFRNPVGMRLLEVHHAEGSVVCTHSHPFYTQRGWVTAAHITERDEILRFDSQMHDLQRSDALEHLTEVDPNKGKNRQERDVQEPRVQKDFQQGTYATDKFLTLFRSNEDKQSNVETGNLGQDEGHIEGNRSHASCPGWKWQTSKPTRADVVRQAGYGNADSGAHQNGKGFRLSNLLQTGHGRLGSEVGDRSGRAITLSSEQASPRQEEGRVSSWIGVDSVKVHERGSDGTFGGLCPDGFVYNLEVEGEHTYTANGIVVHNCHHSTSDSYKKVINHFGLLDEGNTGRLLAGFTATVNRSDGTPMGSVYDEIVFSYDIKDAIDDGWLVAIKGIRVKTDVDISKVATVAGDLAAGQLAQTVNTPGRNRLIVEEWVREAYPRQTVAFCVDVQHSKDLCAAFQQTGVPAQAIWGGDPDRRTKLEAFRQGHIKVLCNCQILTEGFDMWQVACVIMACPTKSQAKFIQCTGRGSRLQEGIGNLVQWRKEGKLKPGDKEDLLLIDVCDVTGRHSLVTLPSLFGLGPKLDLNGTSVMAAVRAVEAAQLTNPDLDLCQLDDIRNLKSFVETVNLWSISFCSEIADVSELCWHKFLDNSYRLLMPGRESLTITGDLLGQYAVKGILLGERIEMKGFTSLPDALAFAEHNVSTKGKSILTLLRRAAAWHKQPVSDGQIKMLRGFKMPASEIAKHNKGTAAQWINKKLGARKR